MQRCSVLGCEKDGPVNGMCRSHFAQDLGRRPKSAEQKAKMSAAALGRPKSDAARAAMSAAKKGKPGRRLSVAEKEHLRTVHTGKKLSDDQKEKLRIAKTGKPGHWAGKIRGPMSLEWRDAIRAATTGRKLSPEHVAKISGVNSCKWGKPPAHGKRVDYNGTTFRSSYEARFAQALDRDGIAWQYEPKRFDLGTCTYLPDFYLPDTGVFWEVKGWLGPDSQKKTRLFREIYPEIPLIVATKPVLQMIGF